MVRDSNAISPPTTLADIPTVGDRGLHFGLSLPASHYTPLRSVIGRVERSGSGNVVLRVGRENEDRLGWHQTEHVLLSADEAYELADAIRRQVDRP